MHAESKQVSKRFVTEVVELDRDCELGRQGARAVVTSLDDQYMTLVFPNRGPLQRAARTGADYRYLRGVK
jgi:hypothetical protein